MTAGGVIAVDGAQLVSMSGSAIAAGAQIEEVIRQAGSIIGSLDGRGWDIGAVQGKWGSTRSGLVGVASDLAASARDLINRATLIALFENGPGFGVPGNADLNLMLGGLPPGLQLPGLLPSIFGGPLQGGTPFEGLPGGPMGLGPEGGQIPGYDPQRLQELKSILAGEPGSIVKGSSNAWGKSPAALVERGIQLALAGSPGSVNRAVKSLGTVDKTVGIEHTLLDAHVAALSFHMGGKNFGVNGDVLAAHAQAGVGLNADLREGNVSAEAYIAGELNLVDANIHATKRWGNDLLGGGLGVTADGSIGANAHAQLGLKIDASKGDVNLEGGAGGVLGAQGTISGSGDAEVLGVDTSATGSVTGIAGLAAQADGDVNVDPSHLKVGWDATLGVAVIGGVKVHVGVHVDGSDIPHAVEHAAGDLLNLARHWPPKIPGINLSF